MKNSKLFLMMAVAMLVFCFIGTQAFAAGEGKKYGDVTDTPQQTGTYKGVQGEQGVGQSAMSNRVSEIIGRKVKNDKGEDLGEIEDVVISQNGQVQYLILAHGGFLGIGENLIPIPYKMAQVDQTQDAIILSNVDKQKLEAAPNFDKMDWKSLEDADMESRVYGYYGQEPGGLSTRGMREIDKDRMTPGPEPRKEIRQ